MPERNPNVVEVRVLNNENNTHYYFYVREDRLRDFFQFILNDRHPHVGSWMPGLSWAATFGLKAIFCRIPEKFPALDILDWLNTNKEKYIATNGYTGPLIDIPEIEDALGRFPSTATQLYQDGSGDEIRMESI